MNVFLLSIRLLFFIIFICLMLKNAVLLNKNVNRNEHQSKFDQILQKITRYVFLLLTVLFPWRRL